MKCNGIVYVELLNFTDGFRFCFKNVEIGYAFYCLIFEKNMQIMS